MIQEKTRHKEGEAGGAEEVLPQGHGSALLTILDSGECSRGRGMGGGGERRVALTSVAHTVLLVLQVSGQLLFAFPPLLSS